MFSFFIITTNGAGRFRTIHRRFFHQENPLTALQFVRATARKKWPASSACPLTLPAHTRQSARGPPSFAYHSFRGPRALHSTRADDRCNDPLQYPASRACDQSSPTRDILRKSRERDPARKWPRHKRRARRPENVLLLTVSLTAVVVHLLRSSLQKQWRYRPYYVCQMMARFIRSHFLL